MEPDEKEQIIKLIKEIRPYRNFNKEMFNGFQMAKMSILLELSKHFEGA